HTNLTQEIPDQCRVVLPALEPIYELWIFLRIQSLAALETILPLRQQEAGVVSLAGVGGDEQHLTLAVPVDGDRRASVRQTREHTRGAHFPARNASDGGHVETRRRADARIRKRIARRPRAAPDLIHAKGRVRDLL